MSKDNVFSVENFNVIQDEEYYYVFRALSNGDHSDIENNITADENGISRIRTDRERWEDERGEAKYSSESDITLEEVWDHIRVRYSKETNCISLSSNANVSLDYGQSYNNEYVMVKVPKEQNENVYDAGSYMLEEVQKRLEEQLGKISKNSEILSIVDDIDSLTSYEDISQVIDSTYDKVNENFDQKRNMKLKASFLSRLDKKQYFSDEQQLQYNKIIAKVTLLEMYGIQESILETKQDNQSLIATIGMAFSSGELIHYKDIQAEEMMPLSKEMMNIIALIQQMKEKSEYRDQARGLEQEVLNLINQGYDLRVNEGELTLSNEAISMIIKDVDEIQNPQETEHSISEIYELTKGKVGYEKAKTAVDFAYKVGKSRNEAIEYSEIIKAITNNNPEYDEVIQGIAREGFVINKDIVSRQDGRGMQIAESVSLGLDRTNLVSSEEQLKIISAIQETSEDKLESIVDSRGLNIENDVIDNILEQNEEISENRYYAEAIIDALNFSKIYKSSIEERTISDEERTFLIDRLYKADCKKLYHAFEKAGAGSEIISQYIINLVMDEGYKGYDLEELSRLDNLDEIIYKNIQNLNKRVQPLRLDKLLGIEDDAHQVDGTEIKLRDYQQETIDNIDQIFEDKRFASVILPTGAGKSFVAITEMMKYKNSNILFIAPQKEILTQFQRHIIKNVLNRKDVAPKDASKVVEEAFPHLKMFCYKTLESIDDEWLEKQDPDLIVLDELHRSGAPTWEPKIKKLIDLNPDSKILGMTATPIRDVDHKDMARAIAEMTGDYTQEELNEKQHLATEMTLLDAIQDEIVVAPKIVTFDYTLAESQEYQEVKKMIAEETDPAKKEDLTNIYNRMTAIIKDSEKDGMGKIIDDNMKDKSGRYIVFLPNNPNAQEVTQEEYMLSQIERVKEDFKQIDAEPETGYLISDRAKDIDNSKDLANFEESDSEHLKLLFAINKLNEGVHVDKIKGSFMMRPIGENSKILYLQQVGRCVFSLDPNNPLPEEDIPIIFDVYNNYLLQNLDREANKTNTTSDLQRLQSIVNWMNAHKGYIPDINSENLKEARKAVALKKIQTKYEGYLNGIDNKNLSESEKYEIAKILELAKSIELWEMDIPERERLPGERDIVRNNIFKATGTQKEFIDLFKEAKSLQKDRKMSPGLRIRGTLEVLDMLAEYGIEISNENIDREDKLEDILATIPDGIKKEIQEVMKDIDVEESFELGEEYNYVKEAFYDGKEIFTQYDVRDLRKYGIFEPFINSLGYEHCSVLVDKQKTEFISKGPKEFRNINIKTATYLDEQGYDIEGRDEEGYDREGYNSIDFNRDGIHRVTQEKYNNYGFDANRINKETGTILDPGDYDIDGYFYELQEDGTYKNTGEKYNKDGYDRDNKDRQGVSKGKEAIYYQGLDEHDFDAEGNFYRRDDEKGEYAVEGARKKRYIKLGKLNDYDFDVNGDFHEIQADGTYINTGEKHNKHGFDIDCIHKVTGRKRDEHDFDIDCIHKETGTILNPNDFNIDGYFYEKQADGTYVNTGKKQNQYDFDIDGDFYELQEDGTYRNTGEKFNKHGFDINHINKDTKTILNPNNFDIDGYNYELQEDGTYRNTGEKHDGHGFDIDCIHKETGTILNPDDFDINGYFYELQEDGTYKNTGEKYNKEGYNIDHKDRNGFDQYKEGELNKYDFDKDGYFYELQEDGTYENTGNKYNRAGFTVELKHVVTKNRTDLRKFNIDGICLETGTIYDKNGYKQDGTYQETGEKFHEGYNAWGVDKDGKDRNGRTHSDIVFATKYIEAVMSGRRSEFLKQYRMQDNAYTKSNIDLTLARASDMNSKVKFSMTNNLVVTRREIKKREKKLEELRANGIGSQAEITKLENEQKILQRRIEYLDYMADADRDSRSEVTKPEIGKTETSKTEVGKSQLASKEKEQQDLQQEEQKITEIEKLINLQKSREEKDKGQSYEK